MQHKRPHQLSGGEQQRGAIAVALANGPRLLLADEPTGELDDQTAGKIIELLHALTRTLNLTVILVTHDPSAAAVADRTIAIRDGRTSTETVRRDQPLAPVTVSQAQQGDLGQRRERQASVPAASAVIGLPASTHREAALVDGAGRMQLPEEATRAVDFAGRAELRIGADHVELWPVGANGADAAEGDLVAYSAVIGLPSAVYREAVVIDRPGRLQLSEEALERVPFGRHAAVRIEADHVELWPLGVA
jgi:energy-coupling factor transporter ATP-binding protein EcfA2